MCTRGAHIHWACRQNIHSLHVTKIYGHQMKNCTCRSIQNKFDISKCTIAVKGNNTSDALKKTPLIVQPRKQENRTIKWNATRRSTVCAQNVHCRKHSTRNKHSIPKRLLHTLMLCSNAHRQILNHTLTCTNMYQKNRSPLHIMRSQKYTL